MDEPLSCARLRALTDDELIARLRTERCELFIGRAGQLSLMIAPQSPGHPMPALLIREAFRRRARLLPFARVNGIRLRGIGSLTEAA